MSTPEKRIPPAPISSLFESIGPREEDKEHPLIAAWRKAGKLAGKSKEFLDSLRPPPEARDDPRVYGRWLQETTRKVLGVSDPKEYEGLDDFQKIVKGNKEMFMMGATEGPVGKAADFAGRTFSRLEKVISDLPADKGRGFSASGTAPGGKWLASLMAKGGFKARELEETGLKKFLTDNSGNDLSREQLLEKARGGRIGVSERVFGGPAGKLDWKPGSYRDTQIADPLDGRVSLIADTPRGRFRIIQQSDGTAVLDDGRTLTKWDSVEEAQKWADSLAPIKTHPNFETYKSYTEPGGENYREVALMLDDPKMQRRKEIAGEMDDLLEGTNLVDLTGDRLARWQVLKQESDELFSQQNKPFTGGHYKDSADLDNVIGHIRMKDRVLPNGEKVLFVEEIQSDWSKSLRRRRQYEALEKEYGAKITELKKARTTEMQKWAAEHVGDMTGLENIDMRYEKQIDEVRSELYEKAKKKGVSILNKNTPEMPFEKAEDWVGLTMKRVMDEAVQGNYDRIAWVTGEQSAKRYSLRNVVEEIEWDKENGQLLTRNRDGDPVKAFDVSDPSDLDQIVGREVAEKLRSQKVERITLEEEKEYQILKESLDKASLSIHDPDYVSISQSDFNRFQELNKKLFFNNPIIKGADLEMGGEEHLELYNNILPKTLKNYMEKQLGVKVGMEDLDMGLKQPGKRWAAVSENGGTVATFDTEAKARNWESVSGKRYEIKEVRVDDLPASQKSIRLTPELKAKVSGGQPLLSAVPALGLGAAASGRKKEEEKKSPFDLGNDPISKLFTPIK